MGPPSGGLTPFLEVELTTETKPEVLELEKRLLACTDPVEKQRLIRELVELTKKETRG